MQKKKFFCLSVRLTDLSIILLVIFMLLLMGVLRLFANVSPASTQNFGRLAIVIDDFGLQRRGVEEMLALDCKLTVAVMPFLTHSEDDAENAMESGKEVIIHIPMQATTHDVASHLGPRPIRLDTLESEIDQWICDALEDIPGAMGANIHMGTLSSTKEQVIRPVLSSLKERGLYFLDSKTSSKSVCRRIAGELSVCFYENNVFLEHEMKTLSYVKKRLRKAMTIAQKTGTCIAIGHVGYEGGMVTVQAIREMLPEFSENNIELVFVSELSPMTINSEHRR